MGGPGIAARHAATKLVSTSLRAATRGAMPLRWSSQEAVASWDQASSVSSQKVTPALDAEVVTSLAKAGLTQHLETFLAKVGLTQHLEALRGNGVGTMGILEYLDEADMRECGLEPDQATLVRLKLQELAAAAAEAQREKLERKPVRGKGNGKHRTCAEVPVLVLPLVLVVVLVLVLAVVLVLVPFLLCF